ncbi:unnamed protein product [Phytophthora fragariaefolia]|uniref:Unnamed protein product n=1 Tax=Phytophthora fragariaefolia TaxID=1490495 RepID=A0A9W6UAQ9_9STRA|nr:unnamed protein product [Phytophthora fragariaefolia]
MAKKQTGVNTKVEAAKAKKAAAKASKDAAKAAADAAAESADWAKGSDARGERRRQEEERKRAENEVRKAEKQKLLALEEHALDEDKGVIRKQKKAAKEAARPWEEALKPAAKKSNRGLARKPAGGKLTQAEMAALREAEEARSQPKAGRGAIKFDKSFTANRNRAQDEDGEARSLDAALDLLSVGDKELEKHPERRAKAAYKAFEEVMLPQVKEDYPGLKLSQYKQKLSEMVRRFLFCPSSSSFLLFFSFVMADRRAVLGWCLGLVVAQIAGQPAEPGESGVQRQEAVACRRLGTHTSAAPRRRTRLYLTGKRSGDKLWYRLACWSKRLL